MNEFASNVLIGAKIARCAIVLSDQNLQHMCKLTSMKDINTKKTFQDLLNFHVKMNPSFDIDVCLLYDQAKLLSSCIFKYVSGYVSKFKEGNVIFRPCRIHSRAHYELLSDAFFRSKKPNSREVSILSAPVLIRNWLTGILYFEYPEDIVKFLNILDEDSNVEVTLIKSVMKENSLIRIALIINNLDRFERPPEAKMSSFFIELQVQFSWAWYLKHQTFRLEQIAKCDPKDILKSQKLLKKVAEI